MFTALSSTSCWHERRTDPAFETHGAVADSVPAARPTSIIAAGLVVVDGAVISELGNEGLTGSQGRSCCARRPASSRIRW
jgi:hypothetical protein